MCSCWLLKMDRDWHVNQSSALAIYTHFSKSVIRISAKLKVFHTFHILNSKISNIVKVAFKDFNTAESLTKNEKTSISYYMCTCAEAFKITHVVKGAKVNFVLTRGRGSKIPKFADIIYVWPHVWILPCHIIYAHIPTVRPQLSYTTFGDMLPMYTKLEFCNQILTTCGYVPYVWCVQAI